MVYNLPENIPNATGKYAFNIFIISASQLKFNISII